MTRTRCDLDRPSTRALVRSSFPARRDGSTGIVKTRQRLAALIPATVLAALLIPLSAGAAPEQFDTSFGTDGRVVLSTPPAQALRVRAGPQGSWIVPVAAQAFDDTSFAPAGVWRLTPDGHPDPAFGNGGGFVHASTFCATRCTLREAVVTADGIVLMIAPEGSPYATRILRLAHDGSVDAGFGTRGQGGVPAGLADAVLTAVAPAPDHGIFVVAYTNDGAQAQRAWKLDRSGAVDPSFGVVALPLPAGAPVGAAVDAAGRLLAAADVEVARVLARGALDPTYAAAGVSRVLAATQSRVRALLALPGGALRLLVERLVGPGTTAPDLRSYVAALNDEGALDAAFGDGGFAPVLTDRGGEDVYGAAVARDAQDRLVVAGTAGDFSFLPFSFQMRRVVVARLDAGGQPDLHFAPGGSTTFWEGSAAEASDVALTPSGGVLVAGAVHDPPVWGGSKYPRYRPRPTLFALQGGSTAQPRRVHETGVIEYFHVGYGHYFMTSNPAEASALDRSDGWARTGQAFRAWALEPGVSPVCRFWSDQTWAPKSSHFYTHDAGECAKVKTDPAWRYEHEAFALRASEGVQGARTCPPGSQPLYRAYNDGKSGAPNHRYTIDPAILDAMLAQGWIMEGEAVTRVFACVPQP